MQYKGYFCFHKLNAKLAPHETMRDVLCLERMKLWIYKKSCTSVSLEESEETTELSTIPRLTPSVPRQVSSTTTTVLPIGSDQTFKGSMTTTRFHSSMFVVFQWFT